MKRYILIRIIYAFFILFGTVVIAFVMVRLLPGDPIRAAMQKNLDLRDETVIQEMRARYALDDWQHAPGRWRRGLRRVETAGPVSLR